MNAILYCRVSSEEQAKGFSLESQEEEGKSYAAKHGINILRTFKVVESASQEGREVFNEAILKVKAGSNIKAILVFKMDRAIRNLPDMAAIDELARRFHKEIHFFHEGWTYTEDSTIADFYRFGFMSVMATGFSRNLSDITKIGMKKKAESGQFPGPAPYGYSNNKEARTLEVDQLEAPWVVRIKELAAEAVSVDRIVARLKAEGCPFPFGSTTVERIINSTFYSGLFLWGGQAYRGAFPAIIDMGLHEAAVRGLKRLNKPKNAAKGIAYQGLISCGYCGAAVSGEEKKGKYVYYRCRQRCAGATYVEEHEIENEIEEFLCKIHITQDQAQDIIIKLEQESGHSAMLRETKLAALRGELRRTQGRLEHAYEDKLDGKLEESEWMNRARTWKEKVVSLEAQIISEESAGGNSAGTLRKIVELVEGLKNQFKLKSRQKRGEIVDCMLSNLRLTGNKLEFTVEKPWDSIIAIAEKTRQKDGGVADGSIVELLYNVDSALHRSSFRYNYPHILH